jgi:hypothetical protein
MNQKSLNLVLFSCILFFAAACKNDTTSEKVKQALLTYNTCLKQCDEKEAACFADYQACLGAADTARAKAGVTCSHVPPANRQACINQAIDKLEAARMECFTKLKLCLGEVTACRKACGATFTLSIEQNTN